MEQTVELARDEDACGEQESSPKKDLSFMMTCKTLLKKEKARVPTIFYHFWYKQKT